MVSIPNIKHLICLLSASRYLTNPRYLLQVPGPGGEEEEEANPVMVVVSLMQKNRRQMYDEGEDQLLIGFEVFEVDIIVEVVFTQCATPGGGAGGGPPPAGVPRVPGVGDQRQARAGAPPPHLLVQARAGGAGEAEVRAALLQAAGQPPPLPQR